MRYKLLYFLLFGILASGCSTRINLISRLVDLPAIQTQSRAIQNDLKIINSKTNVKQGEFGFITIQGRPGTNYKITTSFRKSNRTVSVTQWRVTGVDGLATFNWFVEPETAPGTYAATISGGRKRLNVYHTVSP